MGFYVLKPDDGPDDFFVIWSTYVDNAVEWGTKEELTEWFVKLAIQKERERIELYDPFGKATEEGSSSRFGSLYGEQTITVGMHQEMKRQDLLKYVESYDPETRKFDESLLTEIDFGE